mgnify:CR=1 FL=1
MVPGGHRDRLVDQIEREDRLREHLAKGRVTLPEVMVEEADGAENRGPRLSFTHAVRVIKRKMPQAAAVPP